MDGTSLLLCNLLFLKLLCALNWARVINYTRDCFKYLWRTYMKASSVCRSDSLRTTFYSQRQCHQSYRSENVDGSEFWIPWRCTNAVHVTGRPLTPDFGRGNALHSVFGKAAPNAINLRLTLAFCLRGTQPFAISTPA